MLHFEQHKEYADFIREIEKRGFKKIGKTKSGYEHPNFHRIWLGLGTELYSFQGYYHDLKLEGRWMPWELNELLECLDALLA